MVRARTGGRHSDDVRGDPLLLRLLLVLGRQLRKSAVLSLLDVRDERIDLRVQLFPRVVVDMRHLREHDNAAEDRNERQHREVGESRRMQRAVVVQEALHNALPPSEDTLEKLFHAAIISHPLARGAFGDAADLRRDGLVHARNRGDFIGGQVSVKARF